ncbi:MAG: hypothetical protein PWP41_1973 [Moorella sp. (in: firmicutes)]|uniref:Uncharacterized protein n=1 Tax=Neomoorella thermoacetica TaxID=1525 RepID=A0A1J5NR27_NEOTH|nr:hypothetical protein [Moorella sp. (in: firmicutes)]OIQ61150.1 hypothetical protein MOTE_02220 [Moorella thermoacetica]
MADNNSNTNTNVQRVTLENFIRRLASRFQDRVVNVEFFCGECCKKAKGGKLKLIGRDFIELTEVDNLEIEVITFSGGHVVDNEFVDVIIIPLSQVCSVEIPEKCNDDDKSY